MLVDEPGLAAGPLRLRGERLGRARLRASGYRPIR